MSSASSYAESVGSCRPPSPLSSPPPTAVRDELCLPVRRQLDFAGDDPDEDEDIDFICRVADEMERNRIEAERRAPEGLKPSQPPAVAPPHFPEKNCVCLRGLCDVVWETKEEREGWAYVCPSTPKCKHLAWCEESGLNPNSEPVFWSHPEPTNPCAFNTPNNHRTGATTHVNVSPQGAGSGFPLEVTPQGARSNGEPPRCRCTAGKCIKVSMKGVLYYVCPIPKGQGACAHRELVDVAAEEPPQANGHNLVTIGENNENRQAEYDDWPFEIVDGNVVPTGHLAPSQHTPPAVAARGSPSMLRRPIAMVQFETPTKSHIPPHSTISPITQQNGRCFTCHEEGHWVKNCPKKNTCHHCGKLGHWRIDCPELRDRIRS